MENKKSKNLLFIVLGIFTLLFVFIVALILGYIIRYQQESKDATVIENTSTNVSSQEELTDDEAITLIKRNIELLSNSGLNYLDDYGYYDGYIYSYDYLDTNNFPTENKLRLVLQYMSDNYDFSSVDLCSEYDLYCNYQFTYEEVEDLYYDVFNENISLEEYETIDYTCPMYLNDIDNQLIYASSDCGGTGYATIYTYISSISYTDEYVYAYVSFAASDEQDNTYLYSDYQRTTILDGYSNVNFEINEDNYQDFTQYKYTFVEDNGKYYFSNIEKL